MKESKMEKDKDARESGELVPPQEKLDSAAVLQGLLHCIPDAVVVTNESGIIINISKETLRIFGFTDSSDMVGKHAYDFIAPFDRERAKENIQRARDESVVRQVEYVIQRGNGTFFVGEMNHSIITYCDGTTGFIASIRDITDFKIEHQILVEREQQLREAQSLANIGSFRFDVKTGELTWSAEMFDLLKREEDAGPISPKLYLQYVHEEDRERMAKAWNDLVSLGKRFDLHYRLSLESNKVMYVHGVGEATKNQREKVIRVFGVIHDITPMKERQARLEKLLRENKMLMGELKHRTKNSFSLMSSLISLEFDRIENQGCRELLKEIEAKVSTVAEVFNKLSIEKSSSRISLREYLKGIVDSFGSVYAGLVEGIVFDMDIDEISIDAKRGTAIGLIQTEMLTNTLKYAFPEDRRTAGNRVSISLKRTGDEKSARFCFFDNGIPLAEDFSPLESAGTGMTIITALSTELGGSLTFALRENEKGFIVDFPLN